MYAVNQGRQVVRRRRRAHGTTIYAPNRVDMKKELHGFHAVGSLPIVMVIRVAAPAAEAPL